MTRTPPWVTPSGARRVALATGAAPRGAHAEALGRGDDPGDPYATVGHPERSEACGALGATGAARRGTQAEALERGDDPGDPVRHRGLPRAERGVWR